jgi:hypothetical protein
VFATILVAGVILMVTNEIGWGVGLVIISLIWLAIGYNTWIKHKRYVLSNRDALVNAIGYVQLTASELLKRKQASNDAGRRSPYTVNVDAISAESESLEKYSKAKETLARERLSTANVFHNTIDHYLVNTDEEITSKSKALWQSVDIDALFRKLAEDTVTSLDGIVKGRKKNATP